MPPDDDDLIDGCDFDKAREPTEDWDIPWLVLFCDIDFEHRRDRRHRRHEWEELFDGV